MAYAAAITYVDEHVAGDDRRTVTVVETGVTAATHEYTMTVPFTGTMHLHIATLTQGDGSATTIDSDLFEVTGGAATPRRVWQNAAAAVGTRNTPADAHYFTANGRLYGHSGANGTTGTTGNITTIMVFSRTSAT